MNEESKKEHSPIKEPIDPKTLTTIYKKNGSFDKQRKELLENFKKSETNSNLLLKIKLMVENKIKQDPSILLKNKGITGALIQGEIINQHINRKEESSVLSIVDKDIQDKIMESPEFRHVLRKELKDIKRTLLGISDEDYQKQLAKEKEEEITKKNQELEDTQYENDYKNNFRLKHLKSNHKVSKAPRFSFLSNRQNDRSYRESSDLSLQGSAHPSDNEKKSSEKQNKDITHMMY